ncbi:MAG: hypothetical protein ABEJ90_02770 [Halobacterium sp.]
MSDSDRSEDGGISRRTLIRLLVGLGIGIPVLVEGLTLLGLVGQQLSGDGGDDGDGAETPDAPSGVDVGDEMLPETTQRETLASAILREGGDRWDLTLTADVANTGDADYEFQLVTVTTADGETVSGGASTDRLAPGEETSITGEWAIPAGSTPASVDVVALLYPDGEGSVETVTATVPLAKIPVRGS